MATVSARVPNRSTPTRRIPTRLDSGVIYGRVVPVLGVAAFATSRLLGSGNALTGALVTALWVTAATGWLFGGCSRSRTARRAERTERYGGGGADRGESYGESLGGIVLGQPTGPEPQDVLPEERGQARMPR